MGSFDSPPMGSYQFPIDIYGLSLAVFELLSWLQKHFRTPDSDTMTNTTLEATALSSGKNDGCGTADHSSDGDEQVENFYESIVLIDVD